MSKTKLVFRCQQCGNLSPKWLGRCPECGEWNSFLEEATAIENPSKEVFFSAGPPQKIGDVSTVEKERLRTGIEEFDRVLGGGIVPGSVVLIGGEPGIGKSTLLLQVAALFSSETRPCLIVSGEESLGQIKMRADRLKAVSEDLYLLAETNIEAIVQEVEQLKPALVIIDSIQTMSHPDISSAQGSVSQIRESAAFLSRTGKQQGFSLFFIGHVTKEGAIAGPRILEHMVDTVLYFEGDGRELYRVIRAVKNRFGSTNEVGVFEMSEAGLREVTEPSSYFLKERTGTEPGSVVLAALEGTRPLLVEVQALVTPSYLAMPRRLSTGLDYNRFCLMVAVLERRVGINLSHHDIYVNIGGGIKVIEPAADLAVALAIYSAFKDLEVPSGLAAFGEVSLSGEVRAVSRMELRLKEAIKLGFDQVIMPVNKVKQTGKSQSVYQVRTLRETIDVLKKLAGKRQATRKEQP